MTEKNQTDDATPEHAEPKDDRTGSTGIFFTIIGLIIVGTAGWYAMTLLGSEPVGVERAKELAEEFERECYLETLDQSQCRELIGEHHRDCLFDNIERVESGTGDDGSDVRHDREGYLECMREATGVGASATADSDGETEEIPDP
ncbi:MAG: hypothetical protein ACQEVA_19740 [Myxococcota bacterium]